MCIYANVNFKKIDLIIIIINIKIKNANDKR